MKLLVLLDTPPLWFCCSAALPLLHPEITSRYSKYRRELLMFQPEVTDVQRTNLSQCIQKIALHLLPSLFTVPSVSLLSVMSPFHIGPSQISTYRQGFLVDTYFNFPSSWFKHRPSTCKLSHITSTAVLRVLLCAMYLALHFASRPMLPENDIRSSDGVPRRPIPDVPTKIRKAENRRDAQCLSVQHRGQQAPNEICGATGQPYITRTAA